MATRRYKGDTCKFPAFHPVTLGRNPVSITNNVGSSSLWRKRRAIILKMHDFMCVYCGDSANTVDHVVPISKGGLDNLDNLVAACKFCNFKLGNRVKHILWITPKTR